VYGQLKTIYPSASSSTLWRAIGLIPMIGVNDTAPEVFTLANATTLHNFAVQNGIGLVSYWSYARDLACPSGTSTTSANDSCSGVSQTPYQFAKTLNIPALH
jgi:chitinase